MPFFYCLESWGSPQITGKFVHPCPSITRLIAGYYLDYQAIAAFWTPPPSPLFLRDSPQWARASSFARFLDHTQRRTTVSSTPLDEWSARRRDLYLTTHNTHKIQTSMPPVGFELTISAGERPQTHALVRAATGTGFPNLYQVTVH
jgi:hypothetical protein